MKHEKNINFVTNAIIIERIYIGKKCKNTVKTNISTLKIYFILTLKSLKVKFIKTR